MHTPNTPYQQALAKRAPELNALHMETLAYSIGSTLNGMPKEFFDDVAQLARSWGADRIAKWHDDHTVCS